MAKGWLFGLLAGLAFLGSGCPSSPNLPPSDTAPAVDSCPDDPNKTDPGVCGCGVPDVDANNNGIIDCLEGSSSGGNTNLSPATGSIAGQLSVQLDNLGITVLEREPNDSLSATQFVANVSPGESYSVFGQASVPQGDRFDAYQFYAAAPVTVSFTLTFSDTGGSGSPAADMDLSLHDFTNRLCAPGGVGDSDFAQCFDAPTNPKSGSFDITGPFVLVVTPFSGTAQYELDVDVSAQGAKNTSALTQHAAEAEAFTKGPPPPAPPVPFVNESSPAASGELVVSFDPQLADAERERALQSAGLQVIERSPAGYARVATLETPAQSAPKGKVIDTLRRRAILGSHPGVRSAETNSRRYIATVPNDPFFKYQWHYNAINLPDAWTLTTGSDDVIVAVIDTGILSHHPDLQGRIIAGYDFISDPASARDGDGRDPDPEDPGDLFGGPGESSFHGTHVAGTIGAASNNRVGVTGITWQGKIMPVRVLGADGGTSFDLSEAIRFAAGLPNISGTVPAKPARIINMSLAGPAGDPPSSDETSAISDAIAAGVVVVAAAGNENSPSSTYPSATPGVIGVGAVDFQLNRASYSDYGPTITLMGPGGFNGTDLNGDGVPDGVLSTGASDANGFIDYQYIVSNGTSMATPHVSGVAALVMAANPSLTGAQVKDVLISTARDLGAAGKDNQFGYGLVDAAAAVREALRRSGTTPASAPLLSLSTNSVDLGSDLTQIEVKVSNAGGGNLKITSLIPTAIDGNGWLSAELKGSSANANADSIVIHVDRNGQPNATLHGTITVNADGVTAQTIAVTMSVGASGPAIETIYVLAVAPAPSKATIAQAETDASKNYAFDFSDLPPGQYVLYAGTDRDNDGVVCEVGDLCGAWPSLIQPQSVTVSAGQAVPGANFSVSPRALKQISSGVDSAPTIQRLR
jgi:serine protease